jgi:hypothetical protein
MVAELDLWDSSDRVSVDGGAITMNGAPLSLVDMTSHNGGKYYELSSALGQTVPFSYSGGQLIFSVSGSASFAALTDTFAYVNRDMNVTSPSEISPALSKSRGFSITWDYSAGSADTIRVTVTDDSAGGVIRYCPDNGSTTISASDLASFKTGTLNISVARYSYKLATDAFGRKYGMAAFTEEQIDGSLH